MLARLSRELPSDEGDYFYEPKWDGFRCLAFVEGRSVDLRSRHERPLSRYFPEIVEALQQLPMNSAVLDGEVVVVVDGRFDFATLLNRLHPAASRVERLRREAPAAYVGFDLLEIDSEDLTARPFAERRARLEALMGNVRPPLFLTPASRKRADAQAWLERFQGAGVDGVVAKHVNLLYEPGKRSMIKVKRENTLDCVVAGIRPTLDGQPLVASLLLALYDDAGALVHIGVASNFPRTQRAALYEKLRPLAVPIEDHPWRDGWLLEGGSLGRLAGSAGRWTPEMSLDWIPITPDLVCEVGYDQVDGYRLRHPARFRRWRPDRTAASCSLDQLAVPEPGLGELLPT
jgi:ATP-dependent DNA ligase